MLEAINTWGDYRARVREFDAVLEHGKAVAAALTGLALPAAHARYGVQIFLKLLSHATVLRGLAADPARRTLRELWDVPSMCAIARCVVEAHDAFEYVTGHEVGDAERAFRMLLWELHDAARQPGLAADAARLRAELEGHAHLATLPPELQALLRQRLARGDPPAFHLGLRQRCAMSGVNADWHQAVSSQLSQHVHTLPSAITQHARLQTGSPEAYRLMAMPLVLALPFLARLTLAMDGLAPGRLPAPPSRTFRTMTALRTLAQRGTADR
jgi:hypothetical protein